MSRAHRKCEICGLKETKQSGERTFFAKFPLREHVCKEWVKVVGNEDLVYLPIEKLHDLRHVCGKHFQRRDLTKSKNRLKKSAIPKLGLTAPPLPDKVLEGFPLHMARSSQAPATAAVEVVPEAERPSTSKQPHAEHGPTPATAAVEVVPEAERPSTSKQPHAEHGPTPATAAVEVVPEAERPSTSKQPHAEHGPTPAPVAEAQILTQLCNQSVLQGDSARGRQSKGVKRKIDDAVTSTTSSSTKKLRTDLPSRYENQEAKGIKRKLLLDNIELTPRKKKLVEDLTKTRCTLRSLRKSASLIEKIESPVLKEIVVNAAKNQKRKPKGRRWTMKNKISALAIFKRSPKAYRYLQQVMPLPTEKTLQNMLKKVPMEPGINKSVLLHLKNIAPRKNDKDKVCCLLFDEMAIKPRLILNPSNDCVEGFEDLGELGRTGEIADHALVFMLQGLYQKYKQPIAFYFTKGTISSLNLSRIIEDIITKVTECGFTVLNTVCDQGPTNIGALNILRQRSGPREDGSSHYFVHNGRKVFIIFDVPHLLKSIRNNFLNYGTITMSGKKGQWAHLIEVEKENRSFLFLSKISETHVNPKYKTKMRVKYAAQIMSNTVSAVLKLLSRAEKDENKKTELFQTAEIIHEIDRLFDITNGPSGPKDKKPKIRENVSRKSNHLDAWAEYIKKMRTVAFFDKNGKTAKNVKCIEGYITTLKSLRDIWQFVEKLGFRYLNLRQLNQDALENLFGLLRQSSPTNRNPTAAHFIGALKTAIITKMSAPQIRGSNCEKDNSSLLTAFHIDVFHEEDKENETETELITGEKFVVSSEDEEFPVFSIPELPDEQDEIFVENLVNISGQAVVYVSGYLASRILKNNTCQECKSCLSVENPESSIYDYTKFREWWQDKSSLTYPTVNLCRMVQTATNVTENDIVKILHERNVIQIAFTMFGVRCDSAWFTCTSHAETLELLFKKLTLLLLRRACQKINIKFVSQEVSLADACKKAEQHGKAK